MNAKTFFLNFLATLLIITLFITTYVAFVIFLCCSVQIVISYFISFVTSALIKDWYNFANNLLWIFYSIPFIHLLLGINFKVIKSYFKNIWNVLSYKGIQNIIKSDFEKKACHRTLIILKYVVVVILIIALGTLVVIEIFTTREENVYSIYIGIFSVIPPVCGFFKVLYQSILSFFVKPEMASQSLHNMKENINPEEDFNRDDIKAQNDDPIPENVHQSLIDPCGVINQIEYLNYIKDTEVNHFASIARTKLFSVKAIPGFVVCAFVFISIILNTYTFVHLKQYKVTGLILGYLIRILLYIFSIPFLMIFNFTGLFINGQKVKNNHPFIRLMWIFVLFFYAIFLVVATIFLIVIHVTFKPFELTEYLSPYNNTQNRLRISEPAAICDTKYYNLSILQYAGIAALGQSTNASITKAILDYSFDGQNVPFEFYGNNFSFVYQVKVNDTFSAVSFNSLIDRDGISFLLENYFNDFIPFKLLGAIIPFYTVTHDLILARFLNILTERLTFYIGVSQVSPRYIDFNLEVMNYIRAQNISAVFIGNSIGGMLAKSVGDSYHYPSIAFESLNYYRSLFHASMELYNGKDMFLTNGFEMINTYSPAQLFAAEEKNATMNIKLPRWKGFIKPMNPYETLCVVAAGCTVDGRYDNFCNATIGYDQYMYLYELWNRTRFEI